MTPLGIFNKPVTEATVPINQACSSFGSIQGDRGCALGDRFAFARGNQGMANTSILMGWIHPELSEDRNPWVAVVRRTSFFTAQR